MVMVLSPTLRLAWWPAVPLSTSAGVMATVAPAAGVADTVTCAMLFSTTAR